MNGCIIKLLLIWILIPSRKNEAAFRDESAVLNPNHFSSRAIFGLYASWYFDQLQQNTDSNTQLVFKQSKATQVRAITDGHYEINLGGMGTTHC